MYRLKNKVAIITAGAEGLGMAEAKLFAEEGASVVVTDSEEEKLYLWVRDAKKSGLSIEYCKHDVSSQGDWKKVIDTTIALYGHIDILINNAGVFSGFTDIENTTRDLWDKVININLSGMFLGVQLCIPYMKKAGGGSIVNISPVAGLVAGSGPAYVACKGGLSLLSKHLAKELVKDKIRVNSIHPGGILTAQTKVLMDIGAEKVMETYCPLGRLGDVMELAYGALYFASDESAYTTGAELVIDGGLNFDNKSMA